MVDSYQSWFESSPRAERVSKHFAHMYASASERMPSATQSAWEGRARKTGMDGGTHSSSAFECSAFLRFS